MNDLRQRRQRSIADLLRTRPVASQEALLTDLKALGYDVTQGTVSRDLDQLGAVKIRREGVTSYALPTDLNTAGPSERQLRAILDEWVTSVEPVGQLIVLKTPPGSAHLVGVALDHARLPEVAGTICGDDTIFLAVRDVASVKAVASLLRG